MEVKALYQPFFKERDYVEVAFFKPMSYQLIKVVISINNQATTVEIYPAEERPVTLTDRDTQHSTPDLEDALTALSLLRHYLRNCRPIDKDHFEETVNQIAFHIAQSLHRDLELW